MWMECKFGHWFGGKALQYTGTVVFYLQDFIGSLLLTMARMMMLVLPKSSAPTMQSSRLRMLKQEQYRKSHHVPAGRFYIWTGLSSWWKKRVVIENNCQQIIFATAPIKQTVFWGIMFFPTNRFYSHYLYPPPPPLMRSWASSNQENRVRPSYQMLPFMGGIEF